MQSILKQGRNYWRTARAKRVAFLVDGAAYFEAFRAAVIKAQKSILIVGWDIDSRIRLSMDDNQDDWPVHLGDLLNAVLHRRSELQAHVLIWDFAMIYALERQPTPLYKLRWRTHKHLHFYMDGEHPVGASHHQKIVVIDDALAFVGGFDLTKSRWDTSEHHAQNPRRRNHNGAPYPPFHDVQMMVDADAAAALGDLARERWRCATGHTLEAPAGNLEDIWPAAFEPDMTEVDVAIARTEPAYAGRPEVDEVEKLYLDAIASARRSIYIENQYLTAAAIGEALTARLSEDEGPELVLVLPFQTSGWLEQATMDVLRARLLRKLREADRHGRLKVYYPEMPELGEDCVNVHAKVLVIDDVLVRIGSSNLSNRSMGFDTECDLIVEAQGREDAAQAIARFRNRLLGEHLGVKPDKVAEAMTRKDSLIRAVESLHEGNRTLRELDGRIPEALDQTVPDAALIDPERPLDPETLTEQLLQENDEVQADKTQRFPWLKSVALIGLVLALAALWRWTPLREWLDAETVASSLEGFRDNAMAPVVVQLGFVIGSLIAFPVTVLIVVTALVFGPFLGFFYALLGTALGAGATYGIGHALGRHTVRRLAGSRINRVSRQLGQRGLITVALVRLVPIAPFTVVNLVAGASHVRFRDFMLGTLLGMGPGMLALTVFADSVYDTVRNPEPANFAWIAAIVVVVGLSALGIRRWREKRQRTLSSAAEG